MRVCMHQCLPFDVASPPAPFCPPFRSFLSFLFFPPSFFPLAPLCVSARIFLVAFCYLLFIFALLRCLPFSFLSIVTYQVCSRHGRQCNTIWHPTGYDRHDINNGILLKRKRKNQERKHARENIRRLSQISARGGVEQRPKYMRCFKSP